MKPFTMQKQQKPCSYKPLLPCLFLFSQKLTSRKIFIQKLILIKLVSLEEYSFRRVLFPKTLAFLFDQRQPVNYDLDEEIDKEEVDKALQMVE